MRRAVFSEFVPLSVLTADATLELLVSAELTVYVAVGPSQRSAAPAAIAECQRAGVKVGVWPLLEDSDGRWASAWNGAQFADYTRRLFGELDALGVVPDELLVDLEPPIEATRRLLRGTIALGSRPPPRSGIEALVALCDEAPCPVSAAVAPWLAGRGSRGWQRALGTPLAELALDRIYFMAYTSLIEGYSRRLLARADAEAILASTCRAARRHYGDRAALAIGVIGAGALGDERIYRDPSELARDVAICRAAGCTDIAAFSLGGILDRGDPAAWLRAFATSESARAPQTLRSRAALGVAAGVGGILGLGS